MSEKLSTPELALQNSPDASGLNFGPLKALVAAAAMTALSGCAHFDKAWLAQNVFTAYADQYPGQAEVDAAQAALEAEVAAEEPVVKSKNTVSKAALLLTQSWIEEIPEGEKVSGVSLSCTSNQVYEYDKYEMRLNITVTLDNCSELPMIYTVSASDLGLATLNNYEFSLLDHELIDQTASAHALANLKEHEGYFKIRLAAFVELSYDPNMPDFGNPLPEVQ